MTISRTGQIQVGTSGWQYRHWVGSFYPEGTPPEQMLRRYATAFHSTEVNATFYGLPAVATVEAWREATPAAFVFACKANRYLTHMKKLKDPGPPLTRFFDVVDTLGPKLGPILFQLPPRWRVNVDRLSAFLDALPAGHRYTFEFRDPSWWTTDVYEALTARGAAFCLFDLAGTTSPYEVTADFIYIRLHGPGAAYQGCYDDQTLGEWAARVRSWTSSGRDVFCYFDNDAEGYAPVNARRLLDLLDASAETDSGA